MISYDSRNWFGHLFAFHGSAAPRIAWRVTVHALWATAVVIIDRYWYPMRMQPTVHGLIGLALGLLLVFRTNASYDRFWEGRKAWSEIVNNARNVVRSAASYLTPGSSTDLLLIRNWTVAFAYAAMHSLRASRGIGPVAPQLPANDVASVLAAPCPILAVGTQITSAAAESRRAGKLFDQGVRMIDVYTGQLVSAYGNCERIKNTPLPFAYVVHLRRALLLYLVTLPFALVDQFGWFTVFDCLLIAYVLLGIEEIGVEIENPFGTDANDLPLEDLCQRIEEDLSAVGLPAENR